MLKIVILQHDMDMSQHLVVIWCLLGLISLIFVGLAYVCYMQTRMNHWEERKKEILISSKMKLETITKILFAEASFISIQVQ